MPTIHWLRNDLRLDDNPALQEALKDGEVLPVFVLDPRLWVEDRWGHVKTGPVRTQFLWESLQDLRSELEASGGFNEDTVTDDLDLSFRLLTHGALVGLLWDPPVQEEAVPGLQALWKQRQRWAEGGLQRFFDYWPGLLSNRLTVGQRRDLACFFLLQYALPVLSFADLVTSALTRTSPVYWPLSVSYTHLTLPTKA